MNPAIPPGNTCRIVISRLIPQKKAFALPWPCRSCSSKMPDGGACRVHGGGFAGVILSIIPSGASQDYIRFMSEYMGGKNIFRMSLRDTGAIHLKQ